MQPRYSSSYQPQQQQRNWGAKLTLFLLADIVLLVVIWLMGGIHIAQSAGNQSQPACLTDTRYYARMACQSAIRAGIADPDVFVRQIEVESDFHVQALSPAGAEGIAQFMPDTARELGIDPWQPQQALAGAARLMARYLEKYHQWDEALAAYNSGKGTVDGCLRTSDWWDCLPVATRDYIQRILETE